jgi:hypothetical protein
MPFMIAIDKNGVLNSTIRGFIEKKRLEELIEELNQ